MIDVIDTGIAGLVTLYDEESNECSYFRNGREMLVCGEYDSGELWIEGEWFTYSVDEDDKVTIDNEDGKVKTFKNWTVLIKRML